MVDGVAEYLIATASGVTLLVVGAMATGARRWAQGHTQQLDGLAKRLEQRLDRSDARMTRLAAEQSYDRERIVRVETALLFAQSPAEGGHRALEALIATAEAQRPPLASETDLGAFGDLDH